MKPENRARMMTANRLADGVVVWLSSDHSWVEAINRGRIASSPEGEVNLERAALASMLKGEVVDIALIEIELVEGEIRPVRLRERIRAAGPSVRPDLGKQAHLTPDHSAIAS